MRERKRPACSGEGPKGHLPGESGEEVDAEKRLEENENDKRAKQLIEKDNQIRQALQLLQTGTSSRT